MLVIREKGHLNADEVIEKAVKMYPEIVEYAKANRDEFFKDWPVDVRWVLVNNPDNYAFFYRDSMFYNERDYMPFDYDFSNHSLVYEEYYAGAKEPIWRSLEEDGELIFFDNCEVTRLRKTDGIDALSDRANF